MFLKTFNGNALGCNSVGDLVQLQISESNMPALIDVDASLPVVGTGRLAGFEMIPAGDGSVYLRKDGLYVCAAPAWDVVEINRQSAGGWEKFELVDRTQIISLPIESGQPDHNEALRPASAMWGKVKVVHATPTVSEVRGTFYVPWKPNGAWGIFNSNGDPVPDAMTGRLIYNIPLDTEMTSDDIEEEAHEDTYIYAGFFNCHFGHFIVDTLPRFWDRALFGRGRPRILCHADGRPADWFRSPVAALAMGALGLREDDFVVFDRPTKIRNLIIPRPAMVAQTLVHSVYADLCRSIAKTIGPGQAHVPTGQPAFYSRSRLPIGTFKIVNDTEIDDEFRRLGVSIVHPEKLTFLDQIETMASASRVLGSTGSFLHLSIFCPTSKRISALSHVGALNSNFALIDKAAGNEARYMEPVAYDRVPAPHGFMDAIRLTHPRAVARQLMDGLPA